MENVGAELLKEKQQVLISVLCLTNVYIFWVGQKVRLCLFTEKPNELLGQPNIIFQ